MSNFEFRGYRPTPGEKHAGIAEVKAWGKIILRYKIIPKKDGNGFFPATASLKINESGQDVYASAFTIDSNSDREECESVIMSNVRRVMQGPQNVIASPPINQIKQTGTYTPVPPYQSFSAPNMPPAFGSNDPQQPPF